MSTKEWLIGKKYFAEEKNKQGYIHKIKLSTLSKMRQI